MLSFGNTPYYLTGDMNVIISKSGAIQKFIQAGFVVDLPRVWTPTEEEEAQLTFSPLQYHTTGEGTSRIGTVLSNYTGSLSVIAVDYLYELGNGFDHLPIQITLDLQVYTSTKRILERVVPINCQNIQALKWTPLQKEALWNGIWKTTADDFVKAIHE